MTEREPRSTLRVGQVPGVTLSKWRRTWSERLPRHTLEVVEVSEAEQRTVLVAGSVDLCFVRLPVERTGLHAIPLWEEVPVVVAARDHPIAVYDAVTEAEIADEERLDPGDPDAADRVAGGAGVLLVPMSVARALSRRDLVYRPVSDGTSTRIALAWRVDNPHERIEDFVGIVRGRTPNSTRGRSVP